MIVLLPDGREFVTLRDAADYITKLPKAEQQLDEWQTAIAVLLMAAERRGPLMHARIGVMKALTAIRDGTVPAIASAMMDRVQAVVCLAESTRKADARGDVS
jgi:hypothetical protein